MIDPEHEEVTSWFAEMIPDGFDLGVEHLTEPIDVIGV